MRSTRSLIKNKPVKTKNSRHPQSKAAWYFAIALGVFYAEKG
jgi:hypothetical protein